MITIIAKRNGHRRCGIAHSAELTGYVDDFFTAEQLDILKNDAVLIVEEGFENLILPDTEAVETNVISQSVAPDEQTVVIVPTATTPSTKKATKAAQKVK